MLEAQQIRFSFDDRVLFENVSMELSGGELRILFGASGSGKSTFIRILAGFETPDRGRVLLDGTPQSEIKPTRWRRRVVLLHQEPRMFPGTVRDNLNVAARYHDLSVDPGELLDRLDLRIPLDREARTLSGGEKKRLALGRALAIRPDFMLLDEPSASLDESTRDVIDRLILDIRDQYNVGLLVVTHNPDEVELLGEQGYYLRDSRFHPLNATLNELHT